MVKASEEMPRADGLLTPKQVAGLLGANLKAVYRWLQTGRLASCKLAGYRYLVRREDALGMLAPYRPRRLRGRGGG